MTAKLSAWTPERHAALRRMCEAAGQGPVIGLDALVLSDALAEIERLSAQVREAEAPELIICAAIQMPDGYVIRGHRHPDAINVAAGMPRYQPLQHTREAPIVQGFVTSRNRFVGRREASQIHRGTDADLFSEDLY